jgi:hypothetical protein
VPRLSPTAHVQQSGRGILSYVLILAGEDLAMTEVCSENDNHIFHFFVIADYELIMPLSVDSNVFYLPKVVRIRLKEDQQTGRGR